MLTNGGKQSDECNNIDAAYYKKMIRYFIQTEKQSENNPILKPALCTNAAHFIIICYFNFLNITSSHIHLYLLEQE